MRPRDSVDHSFVMLEGCPIGLSDAPHTRAAGLRPTISDELNDTRTPAQRRLLIRAALGAIGFDWLCYWRMNCVGGTVTRAWCVRDYAAPGWPERYIERRYLEVDPRIAFACRYESPFAWDLDTLAQSGSETDDDTAARKPSRPDERLARLLVDARETGLRSGITFSLVSPRSGQQSVLSFSSASVSRHWISDHIVGQAYALGLTLHEYLIDHVAPLVATGSQPRDKPITAVQQRILDALTRGFSDRQIAESLRMSTHNVDYHLRLLKKRFGAANRVHLAYLAGQRELE